MGRNIKTPAEAKLTASTFISILISAFTSAAIVLLLQHEDIIVDYPFPVDGLILVGAFLLATLIGIMLGLVIIKIYNKTQKVF